MTVVPSEDLKKIFAANLHAKVIQMGLTHAQAADRIGVPERTFRAWIYAQRWPSTPLLFRMVEVLDIDDLYLFGIKQCA